MDAPPVRYTKTADGVSVAWQSVGDGSALVSLPTIPFSHLEIEWSFPEYRDWYGALGKGRKWVRYDNRGSGLSNQATNDFSLDGHLADLDGVLTAAGLGECTLFAGFAAGPVALSYAAHHPEKVTSVILWCTWARGTDMRIPRVSAVQDMLPQDWESMQRPWRICCSAGPPANLPADLRPICANVSLSQ